MTPIDEKVVALQSQHAAAVDEQIGKHLLWNPHMVPAMVNPFEGAVVSLLMLNDGHMVEIRTDLKTGETAVTRQTAP